ncbi:MAG: carbohydrate kinase [Pedobacter sp.]|nr:carbohydrate kinase [Pedobacter sp.]
MRKVLSFGELLLRICPDAAGDWLSGNTLPFYVGGAELNVATALVMWKIPSAYFTALPDNLMSKQLTSFLEDKGIDCSRIALQGERMGLYYLHKGKDMKNAGVIYDRANTSFSALEPGSLNWDLIFKDVGWFHFSAICPALSQNVADLCKEALQAARERNITISLDLNYREKLWKYGKDPVAIMPELAIYCDIIMGNIWAAEKMLGVTMDYGKTELDSKEAFLEQAQASSIGLMNLFPNCKAVANTFRFDENSGIRYFTTLYTEGMLNVSKEYAAAHIVDKVGSGDCFMAGLIYGFFKELKPQDTLAFATSASFTKLFIPGDGTTLGTADIDTQIRKYEN